MNSPTQGVRTCYRHPNAPAGVLCQRCDRPICPRCMNQASVGFHCPECLAQGATRVVTARGIAAFDPIVTKVLIGINVAVFVIGQFVWKAADLLTTSNGATANGGLIAWAIEVDLSTGSVRDIGVSTGEWYRLVSSGFMHAGVFHLGVNMWALWILGRITEASLGRSQLVQVYLVALMAGSFGALLVSPDALTVGASGAIFGLMGGLLVVARARGIALRDTGLLGVLGLNLVLTFALSGSLSVGGHLGGLVGGALGAFVVVDLAERLGRRGTPAIDVFRWVTASLVFVALAGGAILVAEAQKAPSGAVAVAAAAPLLRLVS